MERVDYRCISAHPHIDIVRLPRDLFTSNARNALKDHMPFVTDGPDSPVRVNKQGARFGLDAGMSAIGRKYVPGAAQRPDRMAAEGNHASHIGGSTMKAESHRTMLRAALGACSLLIAATLLSSAPAQAQSPAKPQDWNGIVAAAKKEGKLVFYCGPLVGERLVAGFNKLYPEIRVEHFRAPTGILIARMDQERLTGTEGADLSVLADQTWFLERVKEGRLLKPAGPALAGWPSNYMRDGVLPIVGMEPIVILYNRALVATPPRSLADVLRPEFKGKIGTTGIAAAFSIGWYDWLEKTQGKDYLVRLKALEPKFYVGAAPVTQAIAAGEVIVSPFGVASVVTPLKKKGAPVEFVVPDPTLAVVHFAAAFGWSKRPNAALLFLDYVMSADGQTQYHGTGESASPRSGIKGALSAAAITPWDQSAYPPAVITKLTEQWNRIFK